MEESQRQSPSAWLFVGLALTVLYIAVVLWLVWADAHELPELPLNELGDFLAGVFAPLAFLWFVVAVFIQAQELAAQRRELALTREEFEQNRQVAKEQANEAKRTAEFIGSQTDILEDEMEARHQAEAARLLREQFESLFRYSSERPSIECVVRHPNGTQSRYVFPVHVRDESEFRSLPKRVEDHIYSLKRFGDYELPDAQVVLRDMWHRVRSVNATAKELSDADRVRYDDLQIDAALEAIREFANYLEIDLEAEAGADELNKAPLAHNTE